jgi:hypothetical protein
MYTNNYYSIKHHKNNSINVEQSGNELYITIRDGMNIAVVNICVSKKQLAGLVTPIMEFLVKEESNEPVSLVQ